MTGTTTVPGHHKWPKKWAVAQFLEFLLLLPNRIFFPLVNIMLIHFENLIASAWIRNPPGLIICGQGGEVLQYVELPFGGYGQRWDTRKRIL